LKIVLGLGLVSVVCVTTAPASGKSYAGEFSITMGRKRLFEHEDEPEHEHDWW
jgi:hypothetical protein